MNPAPVILSEMSFRRMKSKDLPHVRMLSEIAIRLVRIATVFCVLLLFTPACRKEPPVPAAADVQAVAPADVASPAPAPAAGPTSFTPFAKVDETMPAALEIPGEGADLPLVVIIEAGSYECEYSRKAEPMLARLLAEFPEAARFYLHNPLAGQKQGYLLALAAVAAQKQGRFWEFHRLLMGGPPDLDEDRLLAYARKVGLDVPMFLRDMKRPEVKEYVEKSRTLTAALGLTGTPVFIVNGKVVMGLVEDHQPEPVAHPFHVDVGAVVGRDGDRANLVPSVAEDACVHAENLADSPVPLVHQVPDRCDDQRGYPALVHRSQCDDRLARTRRHDDLAASVDLLPGSQRFVLVVAEFGKLDPRPAERQRSGQCITNLPGQRATNRRVVASKTSPLPSPGVPLERSAQRFVRPRDHQRATVKG